MAVVIATDPYRRTFYSNCCSTATWFCVIIYILIFLVPFLLSNIQHNLWRARYEVQDTGKIDFNGNIVYIGGNQGFAVFDQFVPTISNAQFSSASLVSDVGSANSDTVKFTLRVYTDLPATGISGDIFIFLSYNSYSSDLKYLNFTDVVPIPITVTPDANVVKVTGSYFLDQKSQYNISEAVRQSYSKNAFEMYQASRNVLDVYNKLSGQPFKIGLRTDPYSAKSSFNGFEIQVNLERSFKRIKVTPSVASVLRNSWPVYIGLFIPVAIFLRFLMKQGFQYQLFPTSNSVKFGDTEIHRIF